MIFSNLTLPQIPGTLNIASILEQLSAAQVAAEQKCIVKVIEKLTGRSFTLDDQAKVNRVFTGRLDKYTLCYEKEQLGFITFVNQWFDFAVKFEPLNK